MYVASSKFVIVFIAHFHLQNLTAVLRAYDKNDISIQGPSPNQFMSYKQASHVVKVKKNTIEFIP